MSRPARRPTVVLHIGAMKTGTTFLQHVMMANRTAMAEAGYPFAGSAWVEQVRATQDVLHLHQSDPRIREATRGAWKRFSRQLLETPGTPVVSMEFLSFARRLGVRRIARGLSGADVHVVLTVRDAQSVFPTQWQTSVTSGARHAWGPFQKGVRRAVRPGWRGWYLADSSVRELRRTQDIPAMIERWLTVVPPERLHVVTVPRERGDEMELWRRLCDAIGLDPAVAVHPAKSANESLGYASTELVRRVNVGLADVPISDYNRTMKEHVSAVVLAKRRSLEARPTMDARTHRAALAWNAQVAATIRRTGVHLVGSLDDLPTEASRSAGDGAPPPEAEVFAAAQLAAKGLTKLIKRRNRKIKKKGGTVTDPAPPLAAWVDGGHPSDLDTAVADLTALARQAIAVRTQLEGLNESRHQ